MMPWWLWVGAAWLALNVLVFLGGLLRAYNRTRITIARERWDGDDMGA